jgi:LETM1 and EF-hand domain-containing protein 1
MEYAKFLQDTAKEMAKDVQTSRSGKENKQLKIWTNF